MIARRGVALSLGVVAMVIGCNLDHLPQGNDASPSSPAPVPTANDAYDQYGGSCPARSPLYGAMRGVGEPCATASDCAPACCPCATTPRSWLASSCIAGKCAAPADACQRTAYAAPWCSIGAPRPPTGACGGNSFSSPSCDACFRSRCCADGDACAVSGSCGALGRCESGCTDQACVDACAEAYPAGVYPLSRLYRCLEVQCPTECSSG
jgi:hypothetical protein